MYRGDRILRASSNAASYASAIAPGQMVVVWGTNMGPAPLTTLSGLDSNSMVSTSMAGVRILFDGVPAPLWYVSATQSAAAVPYLGGFNSTRNVPVEYQGVHSAALAVPISATAPGIFTIKPAAPARAGSSTRITESTPPTTRWRAVRSSAFGPPAKA